MFKKHSRLQNSVKAKSAAGEIDLDIDPVEGNFQQVTPPSKLAARPAIQVVPTPDILRQDSFPHLNPFQAHFDQDVDSSLGFGETEIAKLYVQPENITEPIRIKPGDSFFDLKPIISNPFLEFHEKRRKETTTTSTTSTAAPTVVIIYLRHWKTQFTC